MRRFSDRIRPALALAGCLAVFCPAVAGCRGGSQLSEQEVQQIKQGPPPEMPPQARQMMERAGSGPPPAAQPPSGP